MFRIKLLSIFKILVLYLHLILSIHAAPSAITDATGKKPEMYSIGRGQEISIMEGHELRIECYSGGAKLQFSFPESTFITSRSEHEIRLNENGTYTFLRNHAIPSDTGWYACAEEGIEIDNDFRNLNHTGEDINWIYVYVNSEKPYKFAELEYGLVSRTIIVVAGSAIVVPCRPVSPIDLVELWHNFKLVDLKAEAIRFDPKIGFIMKQVTFVDGEALLQCRNTLNICNYILRYSYPKPRMVTAHDKDLFLQEGDTLRIECSNETKLSFLFPNILSNSPNYEIVQNENGTSTFLRHSIVSDETGWYGCAAMDVPNDYISYHSINDTKKEINWIYVYVNSSASIVSGPIDKADWPETITICCRPTSPELHIHLDAWNDNIWQKVDIIKFDPRVGFLVSLGSLPRTELRCAINESARYEYKDYNRTDIFSPGIIRKPIIVDTDDLLASKDWIIRMTGDDLRMLCKTVKFSTAQFGIGWTIPRTFSENRLNYSWTRPHSRVVHNTSFRKKGLLITITNMKEADSGEYICSIQQDSIYESHLQLMRKSLHVEVFDKNGGRYMRLGKQGGALQITEVRGNTVKWLLDLTDFPTAEVKWFDPAGDSINTSSVSNGSRLVRAVSKRGSPQNLFIINNLTTRDRGVHLLHADIENVTVIVNVTVNVQDPPAVLLYGFGVYSSALRVVSLRSMCGVSGSPQPYVTLSFLQCPKFPSQEHSTRIYFDKADSTTKQKTSAPGFTLVSNYRTNMSGIMTCEACNILNCSVKTMTHIFSDSLMPYFTSTNLNESELILHSEADRKKRLILECYVSGSPYPNVIWFRNDIQIKEDNQHKFAYNNSELSILYFTGEEGGQYKCRAENVHGHIDRHINIIVQGIPDRANVSWSSVSAVTGPLLVGIVVCCIVIYKQRIKASRKKLANQAFEKGALDRFNPELSVVDQTELLPYDRK